MAVRVDTIAGKVHMIGHIQIGMRDVYTRVDDVRVHIRDRTAPVTGTRRAQIRVDAIDAPRKDLPIRTHHAIVFDKGNNEIVLERADLPSRQAGRKPGQCGALYVIRPEPLGGLERLYGSHHTWIEIIPGRGVLEGALIDVIAS